MIAPEFYYDFSCLAGRCRHSCCKGWEIDIDSDTASYYESLDGKMGDELRANITYDEEGCHFILQDGACPFLEADGLCRIIKNRGEDALCDICALHPRFFLDVMNHELAGLGLCCEGVCELLLKDRGDLMFYDDETGQRYTISELVDWLWPGRTQPDMMFAPECEGSCYDVILDAFSRLEPIDERWTEEMRELRRQLPALPDLSRAYRKTFREDIYQRVFAYILYRQLDRVEQKGLPRIISFAKRSTDFIFMTDALWGDTQERIRRWSEQVEYSAENVEGLLQA